jgi:RNA polymerase sigma-70 factor (ECF subfamily)
MTREVLDIAALYERHADDLLMFFVRRTADVEVALDLWAETFAQVVAGRRRYRGRSDAEAAGWLWGIGRKQLAMYYRRGRAERKALSRLGIERPPVDPTLEEEISRRAGLGDLRRELARAVSALSAETRAAVRMRVVDELPYPELAARLRISEPAARARVSRGLRALAHALDPDLVKEAAQP